MESFDEGLPICESSLLEALVFKEIVSITQIVKIVVLSCSLAVWLHASGSHLLVLSIMRATTALSSGCLIQNNVVS